MCASPHNKSEDGSDDCSDFEAFKAADIHQSERSIAASAANTSSVGDVDSDSSASFDSDEVIFLTK